MPIPAEHYKQLQQLQNTSTELLAFMNSANTKAAMSELIDSGAQQAITTERVKTVFEQHGVKLPAGAKIGAPGGAKPAVGRPPICISICVAITAVQVCLHYRENEGFGWGGC